MDSNNNESEKLLDNEIALEDRLKPLSNEEVDAASPHCERYISCWREGAPVLTSEEYQTGHDEEIANCFAAIIAAEAPIEETWLCNRVRETFGIARSGKHVQARSEAILKKVPHKTTRWNGKRFIWRKDQDPDSYRVYRTNSDRDSDRIAFQEIANAVLDVLSSGIPEDEEQLIRDVAERFGYQRVASRIRETFGKAIKDMVKKGLIARGDDGMIALSQPQGSDSAECESAAGETAAGESAACESAAGATATGETATCDVSKYLPIDEPSSVLVSVCGGTVAIPDTYQRLPRGKNDPEQLTGFSRHTDNADIFVWVSPLDKSIEIPFASAESIADTVRSRLRDTQAIIEAGSDVTSAGRRYSYAIWKSLRKPSGVQYDLVFQVEQQGGIAHVHGFFSEAGTTGVRDTTIFGVRANELGDTQKAFEGWMHDPYDPSLTEGLRMNLAEKREFDALFPAHPLSEARRLLAFMVENDAGPAGFAGQPKPYIPDNHKVKPGAVPKQKLASNTQGFEEPENLSDSEQDPVDFKCPACGAPIHFETWTLLNAQKNPELAQRLIQGKLSEFTCPSCGYTTSLAHPCLYLDPEHNVFIYSVIDERMAKKAAEMFAEQPEGRRYRIVTSRLQLQEKAAIFMAGLDDRPMEILKTALTGHAKLQGLVAEGEECEAYFTGIDDGGELLFSIEIGDHSFTSSIDMGGYELFTSDLAESSMADDDPLYVDRAWAYRAIDAIEAKSSDPSPRHQIRYFFEHRLLPQMFFENKGGFVNAVLGDKDLLFKAIDVIFQDKELDNPYSPNQFRASAETIADDISVLKIKYPEPEEEPLCYCSFLFFDAKFEKQGFYCLERGGDLSGDGIPFICSWSEDGVHRNHGTCLLDEREALLMCADIYMGKKTTSKEKSKKGPQMCSTPGCGNPAAYKTRSKPAYCADCIERIAAEADLVLEEPMVKPNDFIMTTCKKCGGRAHYRFNYILEKHDIGERVCRRCYWESWYQDARDQFGASQGHGNLMSEKGAKWLANQFEYDLLDLVQGAIPGEELYHVRCQACGRVTYERFCDMAWRCSCSRKQKGAPKDADKLLRQALDM